MSPLVQGRTARRLALGTAVVAAVVAVSVTVVVLTPEPAGEPVTGPGDDEREPSAPVLDGDGAVLTPVGGDDRRRIEGEEPCGAARPGYETSCGVARGAGADLAWVVATSEETGGLRASVLRRSSGPVWEEVLAVIDDGPDGPVRFAGIDAEVLDLSGTGGEEIVLAFRSQGSGSILDVDVVAGAGAVVVHRSFALGRASARPGRLVGWSAVFADDDPQCCPSAWRREVVGYADGEWRLLSSEERRLSSPPSGELG